MLRGRARTHSRARLRINQLNRAYTAGPAVQPVHYGWTYTNKDWFPTLKVFYMSHEISRRIFRWVKNFKYSNAKPNGFFDIQNPTGFWIQIGTLFCGKVSAACQLPPPLISKWIYSLGPEIFELLCFRPLAPSVFGFFFSYPNSLRQSCFVDCKLQHFPTQRKLDFEPQFCY